MHAASVQCGLPPFHSRFLWASHSEPPVLLVSIALPFLFSSSLCHPCDPHEFLHLIHDSRMGLYLFLEIELKVNLALHEDWVLDALESCSADRPHYATITFS